MGKRDLIIGLIKDGKTIPEISDAMMISVERIVGILKAGKPAQGEEQ